MLHFENFMVDSSDMVKATGEGVKVEDSRHMPTRGFWTLAAQAETKLESADSQEPESTIASISDAKDRLHDGLLINHIHGHLRFR